MQHPSSPIERHVAGLALNAASAVVGWAFHAAEITLNDGAAPEWIHLLPAGRFDGVTPKYGTHELRDPEGVIRASMGAGRDLPIDYDHATDFAAPQGRPAPAAAWITALESRSDGLWGQVKWTDRGRAAVADREYRHISPVYSFDQATGVVGRLFRAALTNNPNLASLTAINSGQPMNELLTRLLSALGLPDGSTEEQALTAVQSAVTGVAAVRSHLKLAAVADGPAMVMAIQAAASAAPDPAKFVPIDQVVALQSRITAIETDAKDKAAEQAVDAAITSGKLIPGMRDWGLALHKADPAKFTAFAAGAPVVVKPGQAVGAGAAVADRDLDADDLAFCSAMGLDPAQFKATRAKEVRA